MTSVGRGRGWTVSKNQEGGLRRPGPLIPKKNSEHLELIREINNLSIDNDIPSPDLKKIEDCLHAAARDKNLRAVFNTLHTEALEDRQFGAKLAALFKYHNISDICDQDGIKLRNILLSSLQTDYEKKDEVREKSVAQYLNAMCLLGEVYSQVRLTTGAPLPLIGVPLLEYMKALLQSASEEDIELIATQISLNGKKINDMNGEEMEKFLIHVRTVLVNRNLSSRSRATLLLIVDIANQKYEPLNTELQAFYTAQLGEDFIKLLQSNQKLESNDSKKTGNHSIVQGAAANMSENDSGIGPTMSKLEIKDRYETSTKSNEINSNENLDFVPTAATNHSQIGPRAIRGLGVRENRKSQGDKSGQENRKKWTDDQGWSTKQNKSNNSWGHDDRFHRDYDQGQSNSSMNSSENQWS